MNEMKICGRYRAHTMHNWVDETGALFTCLGEWSRTTHRTNIRTRALERAS
jgi:hypothetical protein